MVDLKLDHSKFMTILFLARIYTILIDSGDKMLLANFSISTFAALSVFVAAWYYKKPKYQKAE
jgi:hypothetical protein